MDNQITRVETTDHQFQPKIDEMINPITNPTQPSSDSSRMNIEPNLVNHSGSKIITVAKNSAI